MSALKDIKTSLMLIVVTALSVFATVVVVIGALQVAASL